MPGVAQVQHWPPQMCRILTSSQATVLTLNQKQQMAEWTAEDDEYWNHLHQCHVSERSRFSVECASLLCDAVLVVPSAVSGLVSGLQAT